MQSVLLLLVLAAPMTEAKARCILKSTKAPCLQQRLAKLDKAKASKSDVKVTIATNMLNACHDRVEVRGVSKPNDKEQPDLDDKYLQQFQKALLPYGAKIAKCYSALGKWIAPGAMRDGQVAVEVSIGKAGSATQVAVVKNQNIDGYVAGCVVTTLCGLAAPAPKAKFVLELPFTFKAPK